VRRTGKHIGAVALTKKKDTVIIYTDGGCDPNPGVGGWGAVLMYGDHYKELSGGEPETTNNRMELTAVIVALESLSRSCSIELYTDSEYVKKGITEWMPGWKKKNWKRKGGSLKNVDLWKALDVLNSTYEIDWRWVRGHSGDPLNERCDELATEQISKIKRPR